MTVSIQFLAASLVVLHALSVFFIILVIRKQWLLLKLALDGDAGKIRALLTILVILVFIGNLIPISIDVLTLFVALPRPQHLSVLSVSYAYSNALTELLLAVGFYLIYRSTISAADVKRLKKLLKGQQ